MSRTAPILMSGTNPDGFKLEELLAQIADELTVKCDRLRGDTSPVAQDVERNNRDIIARLHECRRLQEHSLGRLATVGPDQGPRGKPRVGMGS